MSPSSLGRRSVLGGSVVPPQNNTFFLIFLVEYKTCYTVFLLPLWLKYFIVPIIQLSESIFKSRIYKIAIQRLWNPSAIINFKAVTVQHWWRRCLSVEIPAKTMRYWGWSIICCYILTYAQKFTILFYSCSVIDVTIIFYFRELWVTFNDVIIISISWIFLLFVFL